MKNQKIAEILLKIQMDDLKDAEKLADYADEVKELGDVSIASALSSRAKARLNNMAECENSIKAVMQRVHYDAMGSGEKFDENGIYHDLFKKHINHTAERIRQRLNMM